MKLVILILLVGLALLPTWVLAQGIDSIGAVPIPGSVNAVAVSGNYAYVTINAILYAVDISDPHNPTISGSCLIDGAVERQISIEGNYAFISCAVPFATIVNLTDPAHPVYLRNFGLLDNNFRTEGIATSNHYAYIASYMLVPMAETEGLLYIYDISDVSNPISMGSIFNAWEFSSGIALRGNYTYITQSHRFSPDGSLIIVDVSNPDSPALLGHCDTPGRAWAVQIQGDYAYVADGDLQVINVADVNNPLIVGGFVSPGSATSLFISGHDAYLADGVAGLEIIDVSNPQSPALVASHQTSGFANQVFVGGDYIYLGVDSSMQIFRFPTTQIAEPDNSQPQTDFEFTNCGLIGGYSDPFAGSPPQLCYALNVSGYVNLSIYNLLGQRVTTLVNGIQSKGDHWQIMRLIDCPSGLYFARLDVNGKAKTKKMVILK